MNKCPACGKRITVKALNTPFTVDGRRIHGVYQCPNCKAVLGTCYKGDSFAIVLPYFAKREIPVEDWRYYDLKVLGSDGISRRHGWYDPATKLILQTG